MALKKIKLGCACPSPGLVLLFSTQSLQEPLPSLETGRVGSPGLPAWPRSFVWKNKALSFLWRQTIAS